MTTLFALPGTMCTDLLWQELHPLLKQKEYELKHIPIPDNSSLTEIIQALADVLPDRPFSLLGFSLGGYLASLFACTFPERVTELTVIANTPCALSENEVNTRMQTLKWLEQFNYNGIQKRKAQAMLNHPDARWVKCIQAMDSQLGGQTLQQQLKATSIRDDLAPALRELTFPVRFIVSKDDPLINQAWLNNIAVQRAPTKIVRLAGHSHMLPLESPEYIAQLF